MLTDCPSPPWWIPINAQPRERWLPANQVIEGAYKDDNGENGVLVGSQFEVGPKNEIRTPNTFPNKEFANRLLSQLRRNAGQLKPDIIDFRKRVIYEIKPIKSFQKEIKEIVARHQLLYEIANGVRDEFNQEKRNASDGRGLTLEPEWLMSNATWRPPLCMAVPGNRDIKMTTAATEYGYSIKPGLIIYELWGRIKRQGEEKSQAAAVEIIDMDTTYDTVLPSRAELQAKVGAYHSEEPDFLVIVAKSFHDKFKRSSKVPGYARSFQRQDMVDVVASRSIPPAFDKRKPMGQFKDLPILTVGAMADPRFLLVGACIILIGAGLALIGPEVIIGGAAGETMGEVISLAAVQLAKKEAAKALAKAAGVLIVFGLASNAKAEEISFDKIDAIRVIRRSQVSPFKGVWAALSSGLSIADPPGTPPSALSPIKAGDTIMFDNAPHYVIATLRATPGKAGE